MKSDRVHGLKGEKELSFLRKMFSKKPVQKHGSDGYLLPEYWQCIVCRAGNTKTRATYAVRVNAFRSVFGDERHFQALDPVQRSALKEFADYVADPVGGAKEPPAVAKQFEDTSGLARDRTGYGFDAVYLCDAHAGELQRAIKPTG
jgi:hypothetical protein